MTLIEDFPCKALQRGFLFLLTYINEEEQLFRKMCRLLCELKLLCDDEKLEMSNGGSYRKTKKLLKCLISEGDEKCRNFLKEFKSCETLYSKFSKEVHSVQSFITKEDIPNGNLPCDALDDYDGLLLKEMEPSGVSDILFCYGVLNSTEHDEIESILGRRKMALKLIEKIRQKPDKMHIFYKALNDTKCDRAIRYITDSLNDRLPPFGCDSVHCVKFNLRELLKKFEDSILNKILSKCMIKRGCNIERSYLHVPRERHLIKIGLRREETGCNCILELIRQIDPDFLQKLFERLNNRRKNGREETDLVIDVSELRDLKQFLLEELHPTSISDILLQEDAISIDDHDRVDNQSSRRQKADVLIDILLNDGSETTLKSFLYALKEYKYILDKFKENRIGHHMETPLHPLEEGNYAERTDENDLKVRQIGERQQSVQDIRSVPGLEVDVYIPVEDDEDTICQEVDRFNNDHDFQQEGAEDYNLKITAKLGSVVLRLVALTDDACFRLFDENGKRMKKLIEKYLQFSNLKEDMIKGNIQVTVSVSETTSEKSEERKLLTIAGMLEENWDLLVEELEPLHFAKTLLIKELLNKDDIKTIMDAKSRAEKVEILIKILQSVQGDDAYKTFLESLDEMGRGDILEKIKPSATMHQEAEKVRIGLLYKLKGVIEEIESNIIEETLKCCFQKDSKDKLTSSFDLSKSRKETVLHFLMFVFMNDARVLALKKVLENRNLTNMFEMPKDETFLGKFIGTRCKYPKGEIVFQTQYKVEKKETMDADFEQTHHENEIVSKGLEEERILDEERIEELCRQVAESYPMDWESYSIDCESCTSEMERQTDVSKPKRYASKKRLYPKPRPMRQAEVAVQPKRIFGCFGKEGSEEEWWSVVVALDFGTTYSGYAFWRKDNDPLDITPGKWKTGSKEVLESLKTPTSLLLNKENEVIEFGFEAERIFMELVKDGSDREYRFFRQFKMILHNKKSFNMDMTIEDHLNDPIKALDVFSLSIRYLKDECIELFQEKNVTVESDEILWILTVPAIWDESAKQFMRKAAERAEIPSEQLKLALEPEAAAIYVIKRARTAFGKESVTTVQHGTKIIVADLGGGTADVTVLELNEDKTIKQLHRSFGGAWRGNLINEKIWEIMKNIFGREIIEEFKKLTADYMDMESIIELRKRDITPGSKLQFPMYPSLADLCRTVKGKGYKELITQYKNPNVKVRPGKLSFEPSLVEEIFDLTLINLYTTVDKALHNPNTKGIEEIILVGELAQADLIVKKFKERFSRYNVIIPTDPVLAVLKGAVMFGQNIDIISSRITAHTYGFNSMRLFTDGDPKSKMRKYDNTNYCVDLFEKLVAIGDSVDVGKTVEKEVFAWSKEMTSMVLKFYQSDSIDPKFVTDPGCECIGKLSVEMPDLSGGTERSVMVSINFGETEITVCGVDKTTGKKQETTLNLLGDTN